MAEAALYGNLREPQFPFKAAADALKWVPAYIDSLTPERRRHGAQACDFGVLVNTLLVLLRTRTSVLFSNELLDVCSEFVTRLLKLHIGFTTPKRRCDTLSNRTSAAHKHRILRHL